MMDIYTQNLAAFKHRKFETEILSTVPAGDTHVEVITNTPSGNATFYYTGDSQRKVLVHSLYNPVKEAFSLVYARDLNDVGAVFVFGLGFGYHLKQLVKHTSFSGPIYVIEPSAEIFKQALINSDLSEVIADPRVHFFIEPNAQKMRDIIDTYPLFRSDIARFEFVYLPAYRQIFASYYEQVLDAINIRFTMNIATVLVTAELAKNWDVNSAENLPLVLKTPSLECFRGVFRDKPVIMVAAGPSLDKTIDYLKSAKTKTLIVCVGTALKPLVRAGITPDFVFALDSSRVTLPQFEGIGDTTGMWLFADLATPPDIVKLFYPRVTFYSAMQSALMNFLFPPHIVKSMYFPCAGSVSNIALMICYLFGCNPIIFMGLDLALQDDGRSHASGTMHEDHNLKPVDNQAFFVTVRGNYQPFVKTPKNFYVFLRWTENFIQKYPDRVYINAGAGGARIEGALLELAGEVLEKRLGESSVNVREILEKVQRRDNGALRRKVLSRAAQARKEMRKLDKYFKEGTRLAKEVSRVIKGEIKLKSAREEDRFASRVRKFFQKLGRVKAFELFNQTVKLESYLMSFSMKQERVRQKGYSDAMLQMPSLFQKLTEMLPVFRKCLDGLNVRSRKGVM